MPSLPTLGGEPSPGSTGGGGASGVEEEDLIPAGYLAFKANMPFLD